MTGGRVVDVWLAPLAGLLAPSETRWRTRWQARTIPQQANRLLEPVVVDGLAMQPLRR